MALLDLALGVNSIAYVDTTISPSAADLINANALNAQTTIYHGDGSLNLSNVIGANLVSNANIVVTEGADLTLSAGLLDVSLASARNLIIDGDSSIALNASTIQVAGLLTNLLNSTKIAFTGALPGTFTFTPPAIGLLNTVTLTVDAMQAGDRIVIPFAGDGINALREPTTLLGQPNGYNASTGYLTLTNGTTLTTSVVVRIKMTQAEYNAFNASRSTLLLGRQDTFIFPGSPSSGQPPYEAPCFARGTMLLTPRGEVAIEDLRIGDSVMTKDNGPQTIRWIGSAKINAISFFRNPNLRPIRIKAGALGAGRPARDLLVSPQHRVLVSSKIAQRMFAVGEVLVAAKQLLETDGIDIAHDVDFVEYFHILLDNHEIVFSDGAETESLYCGAQALLALGPDVAEQIFTMFPDLRRGAKAPAPARLLPAGRDCRALARRHVKNAKPLYDARVARAN